MNTSVLHYLKTHETAYLESLTECLKIPSVSTDPVFKNHILECAHFVKSHLEKIGLESVQIFPTAGHPIVYAQWCHAPGKPTVLLYGHYDVQPADPLELWTTPPFEPTIRDGNLYARGVSDDKGQVFCHLNAIEAWLQATGALPVNVKIIIEGEEEIGSPHLTSFITEHRELLKADVALVSDTPMIALNTPSICFSLRGLLYLEITATGANSDLHSGQNGGAVPNPINALATIISKLKNDQGLVLIPGFYEDVLPISEEVHQALLSLPHSDAAYAQHLGLDTLTGESEFTSLERRWLRPTLDCNGIIGGYTGEGAKTVIPSQAKLKLSMRLVANQDPHKIEKAFKDFLPSITPPGIQLALQVHSGAFPARINPQHPAIQAGIKALEKAFNTQAHLQGEGGTIPVVNEFEKQLGIQTVLMGFNLIEDGIHAPNEKFSLSNYQKGTLASTYFWEELALKH